MISSPFFGYRAVSWLGLAVCLIALCAIYPIGSTLADANVPTVTNTPTPQPTNAPAAEPTQTPTVMVVPTEAPQNPAIATPIPAPPTSLLGGLSWLNRILIVILAIATVLVIGLIVYAIFYQSQQQNKAP